MLAPFFMKDHGYSVALVGIPLVANGVGRVCSDVMSGVMATYFSPGPLLFIAMIVGLVTSIVGYAFIGAMPVFHGRVDCLWPDRSDVRFVAQKNRLRSVARPDGKAESKARWLRPWASALPSDRCSAALSANGLDRMDFFFSMPRRRFIGMIFIFRRRRAPLPAQCRSQDAEYLGARDASSWQDAVPRFLPGDLPIVFVFGRRDPRGVSIPRRQSARHEFAKPSARSSRFPV